MNLLPFNSVKACPACGLSVNGFTVVYSTNLVIPSGDGQFVNVHTMADAPAPHLEKHCPHCRYGWLERVAKEDSV